MLGLKNDRAELITKHSLFDYLPGIGGGTFGRKPLKRLEQVNREVERGTGVPV